uniref:Putative secreted protein n=1 Tax=Anopheles marajoara TaxID=58244 RepID=A0A2M4CC62_9DIPT
MTLLLLLLPLMHRLNPSTCRPALRSRWGFVVCPIVERLTDNNHKRDPTRDGHDVSQYPIIIIESAPTAPHSVILISG